VLAVGRPSLRLSYTFAWQLNLGSEQELVNDAVATTTFPVRLLTQRYTDSSHRAPPRDFLLPSRPRSSESSEDRVDAANVSPAAS